MTDFYPEGTEPNSVPDDKGTERRSAPNHEGTEPDDIKALNHVQSNTTYNTTIKKRAERGSVPKVKNNTAIVAAPFGSHFANMMYLAWMGFSIVPGCYNGFYYRVEAGILYVTQGRWGDADEKTIILEDIFKNKTTEGR